MKVRDSSPTGCPPFPLSAATRAIPRATNEHATAATGATLATKKGTAKIVHASTRQVDRWLREGWFPKPYFLGPRLLRWDVEEVLAAVRSRPRHEGQPEPANLKAANAARVERAKARKLDASNGGAA